MKFGNRILIGVGLIVLLLISWIVAIAAPSNTEKQLSLIEQSEEYMEDDIYICAVPLLEEAVSYDTKHTIAAESLLKTAYLALIPQQGYQRKYISVLEAQMSRDNPAPEIFIEAADFYFERARVTNALAVLKKGIEKTESEELVLLYEDRRYAYQLGRNAYEDVTEIQMNTIAVRSNGFWGLAISEGSLLTKCIYDKVSTFNTERAIVMLDNEIFAIDSAGNRIAVPKKEVDGIKVPNDDITDFGNLAEGRIPLKIDGKWIQATGEFNIGSTPFEALGTYSGGYIAAKKDGKWGVIDSDAEWLVPAEYDEILMDELGRSYGQEAVFARTGSSVYLLKDGEKTGDSYEDARPFGEEGYAAVRKDGQWGYIDTSGIVKIPYQFEDALSFGQHLAAVKKDGFWGYISLSGKLVIEAGFLQAKSFSEGSAPVLTERGWQFITLLEYKQGVSL